MDNGYRREPSVKYTLNFCIKNEPVTVGADATVYENVWFLGQIYCTVLYVIKSQIFNNVTAIRGYIREGCLLDPCDIEMRSHYRHAAQ